MSKETFALINDLNQVVNHIVIDKDAPEFEQEMAKQLTHWGCVRYVETTDEDDIILDDSPEIWTTHTTETGFVLPVEVTHTILKKSLLPADSLLLEENADKRPADWTFPSNVIIKDE